MKSILRKRQEKIAKATLRMPDAIANVMGQTKAEARKALFNPIKLKQKEKK